MRIINKVFNILLSRLFIVILMLLLQIGLFATVIAYFSQQFFNFYILCVFISIVVVLGIVSRHENPDFKIAWIMAIMTFPVIGGIFYLFLARRAIPVKLQKRLEAQPYDVRKWLNGTSRELTEKSDKLFCNYIMSMTGYPVFDNTSVEYYSLGEEMYAEMLVQLKSAERYIFMEYFIITPGIMWDSIFTILKEKAAAGVKIYLIYDDAGTINNLPRNYDKLIKSFGINVCVFNPLRPHVNKILNYRDHRKITVVDGKCAFCGGINLADEYINAINRYGHWKDTGVKLEGRGVMAFVVMFLNQWQFAMQDGLDTDWFVQSCSEVKAAGLVHVFDDSPLDSVNITESVYLHAIMHAEKYIYITTPYLIIDYSMISILCNAALSGVDVRIYTPYKYDKWYVHIVTRSNYEQLTKCGVKIYEYTPGFMHSKMIVTDDKMAMVGTCNMDYRSFYFLFECGVLLHDVNIINKIKQDMLECQELSREIEYPNTQKVKFTTKVLCSLLKLFAPLM